MGLTNQWESSGLCETKFRGNASDGYQVKLYDERYRRALVSSSKGQLVLCN